MIANFLPVSATFWTESACEEKCQCTSEDPRVTCQASGCSADEICQPNSWYHVCRPTHKATCHVLGGRHYTTFDGRLYQFQGNCVYVLSQMCAPSHNQSLEYYRVETGISGETPEVSQIEHLHMMVYGQDITVIANSVGHVMVSALNSTAKINPPEFPLLFFPYLLFSFLSLQPPLSPHHFHSRVQLPSSQNIDHGGPVFFTPSLAEKTPLVTYKNQ